MKRLSIFSIILLLSLSGCGQKKNSESQTDSSLSVSESEETTPSEESVTSESGSDEETSESFGFYDYDGYYKDFTWTDSEDLINKLHNIISRNYNPQKYEGNWTINQGADQALDDHEKINLIYSDINDMKTNTYSNGKGWQREHAFAASLMCGFTSGDAVGVGKGRATDFHNLFAASYSGNTSRGNKNFGIADINAEDGSYQDLGAYASDSKNFEPSITDKGRLARAIFYMAVMYNEEETETVKTTLYYNDEDKVIYGKNSVTVPIEVTYKPLEVVEDYVSYNKVTYTNWYYQNDTYKEDSEGQLVIDTDVSELIDKYGSGPEGYARYSMDNCQFAIGNLSALLDWSHLDVDLLEYQHNDYVFKDSGQNNRNPFVDYPELIDYCFGDKKDKSGELSSLQATYLKLDMDSDEVSHFALKEAKREFDVGETLTSDDYFIYEVNKDLSIGDEYNLDFEYTFSDADAEKGSKTIVLDTPLNDISYDVKVNKGSLNSCSYIYEIEGSAKGCDFNGYTKGSQISLGEHKWTFDWDNASGKIGSKDKTYGLAFGVASNNQTMGRLVMTCVDVTSVNAIYFKGSCKANENIDYSMYVGDTLVASGNISRITGTTAPEIAGDSFEALSGNVKIIISGSGARNGAIFVHTLAFNEVD